jgi:two-component system, cell cycle response regulator
MLTVSLLVALLALPGVTFGGLRTRRRLEAQVRELQRNARVEELTLLRNAAAFKEDLDLELLRSERTAQPASLIVLSVDSRPWTEPAGNAPRQELARVMSGAVREVDIGYRIGADEFALILPGTRARGALVAADRVGDALRAAGAPAGSVAVGVAEAGPGVDRRQLFRNAYVALLAAGRDGRPDVLAYSPELEPSSDPAELHGLARIEPVESSSLSDARPTQ